MAEHRTTLEIAQQLARLHVVLDQVIVEVLSVHRLTRAECDVVGTLRAAGSPYQLRPTELSLRLLLTTGGTSNVLRRLEERGLVERVADPQDGRSRSVRLTAAGIKVATTVQAEVGEALDRYLDAVPAGALDALGADLDVVVGTLRRDPRVARVR